jgi:ataxin-3
MSSAGDGEVWIYHERQEAQLCGQHALNNLVQAAIFSPYSLSEVAQQLDQMELTFMSANNEGGVRSKDYLNRLAEGSGNVDASGNFSIEVLRSALLNQYGLSLPNIRQQGIGDQIEVTEIEGFICNREAHWFAIRKINGRFWNLNSTKERPELISHFHLAAEIEGLQNSGYSVFCVVKDLPAYCTTSAGRERGLPQYWWKESDLVEGKTQAITGATDPWKDVGSGMRLDGRAASSIHTSSGGLSSGSTNGGGYGMTEDEQLQMALAASLENYAEAPPAALKSFQVKPEPAVSDPGAVRIQFRFPNNSGRVVRRFLDTEPVGSVYAFVQQSAPPPPGKSTLELKFGFPPTDLLPHQDATIGETKLSGESIQGRYV